MSEARVKLIMQMEFMACRDEFDIMIRWYHCAVNSYPEKYFPPLPLPLLTDYIKYLVRSTTCA